MHFIFLYFCKKLPMTHIKTIIYGIISLIFACTFFSCSEDEPENIVTANRTILVYMVAGNSLGTGNYDSADINEMLAASEMSTFNNGRLIIYHAPYGKNPSLKEIKGGKITILREYDQSSSSVEKQRMQEVIDDTKRLAPANDYGLILWSHANGWLQNGLVEKVKTSSLYDTQHTNNTLTFGEDQGKTMNITTLANILNDEKFSFIYFDCCYMGSIEVMYELRHTTPYIIASAPETPADGMPYEQNIPLLFANTPKLKEACITTYDYYNIQKGASRSCAISLIDTQHIDELAQATAAIYEQQPTLPSDFSPQKFTLDANCYYFDFEQYIKALCNDLPHLYDKWNESLNKVVVFKAATPYMWNRLKLEHHSGLSTYILNSSEYSAIKNYNQLQWWNDVASKLWQ